MNPSIRKNDRITLTVTGLTGEGSGVGRHDGMAVFVAAAVPGDVLSVHIIKVSKTYAVGKIHQIITPSSSRIPEDCPVNASCGGCAYRQMDYAGELQGKWQCVADAVRRIGGLPIKPQPILHLPNQDGYRNKAQYPVRRENGKLCAGFYAARSHRVVSAGDCRLQPPEFSTVVAAFLRYMEDRHIPAYEEAAHTGLMRHIYIRKAFGTGELMACAVINGVSLPHADYLTGLLQNALPGLTSVCVNYNTAKTNVILGNKTDTVWGSDTITDVLCGLRFQISPNAFYQVNHDGAELLYGKAKEYAGLTGRETVLDLYCGAGTIGLSMARDAGRVIGVEIIPEAVENARQNARLNGIENARFLCASASAAAGLLKAEGVRPDVVVIDPPRKGCEEGLIATIGAMRPGRVVYVSCDPATLARDLKLFAGLDYAVKELTPVDMFPRTVHVECIVLLEPEAEVHKYKSS